MIFWNRELPSIIKLDIPKKNEKRDYRILNDRNIAKGRLEEQRSKLAAIMEKDGAEYLKNLDSLDVEELDDFVVERSVIRPVAEAETRRSLMKLYGEKYKKLAFQKAVEVVNEKIVGNYIRYTSKRNCGKEQNINNVVKNDNNIIR